MVSISEVPGLSYTYTGEANKAAERLRQGHAEEEGNISLRKKAKFCLFNSAALNS